IGLCRIKLRNTGKRNAIDLKIIVRVSAWRIGKRDLWTHFNIRHNTEFTPILQPKGDKLINVCYFDGYPIEVTDRVTKFTRERINSITSFADLFKMGERVNIKVYVFGYDEFSGSRIVRRSKAYTI